MKNVAPPTIHPREIARVLGIDIMQGQSLVMHCTKCNLRTSGILDTPESPESRCPQCRSVLIYCPVCKMTTSVDEHWKVITCHRCDSDFVTDTTVKAIIEADKGSRDVVLSGIRATGRLHLGNYFGAVRQFVEHSRGNNLCLYFIADWHTLTTLQDGTSVAANVLDVATDYLAAGLDPERSVIYPQSSVPEIAELSLYLSMFQNKAPLEALPTLKDIVRAGSPMTLGHLSYPVLMAADILGPRATLVPVGSDQIPNVELARDLADKFNNRFGPTFVVPRVGVGSIKVPGLKGGKMGKSEAEHSIALGDDLATITDKYGRLGVTDAAKARKSDPGTPENCLSVFPMFRILNGDDGTVPDRIAAECRAGTRGCRECKGELAVAINQITEPFRDRRAKLAENPKFVQDVLRFGAIKAGEIIRPTLEAVREKLGIRRF